MEDHCNCGNSCMSVGWWGVPGGEYWSYKPNGPIRQIIIVHGAAIDSIMFKTENPDSSTEYSPRFGGGGGTNTVKINFDCPLEYLTEINGTCGSFYPFGPCVIRSLHFKTNVTQYGPFGSPGSGRFWCPIQEGAIVEFRGHAGDYLHTIGIYAKPVCSLCATTTTPKHTDSPPTDEVARDDIMKMVVPRSPGPWGGSGGKQWDDGVFGRVKQIVLIVSCSGDAIHAVQFQYEKRDGKCVWSPMHGGLAGGDQIKRVNLEFDNGEFLVGISGFYGPIEGSDVVEAIRAICFHGNKGKYGPYGRETGPNFTYFTSSGSLGKLVGFHGRSDDYLSAIGVHMDYI